ncbi:MAG: enoyl-CoA hydratase [Gammaproteobacteria bacterium]|nr:enoyl-CoA hydratase [Gammaproteobacteria bacterium]|tara:strand:+ start:1249 stop:1989 length:741 start_codon:yes stop_codon:yes gene_type:complete
MNEFVQFSLKDKVAIIKIDDGKRNALSPQVLSGIYKGFDRAQSSGAAVIITGRENVFSAGFDLKIMKHGGINALKMLYAGYSLTARIMAYPYPVITACNGHSMAMGAFMMLSTDYIIGTKGDFKIAANEVALGMRMPRVAVATLKNRINPAPFQRAVALSEFFDVESALNAGFFDKIVGPSELILHAKELADSYKDLDARAHAISKKRMRAALIRKIRLSIPLDLIDAALLGLKGFRKAQPKNPKN